MPVYWGRRFSRDPTTRKQISSALSFLRWPGGSSANEYIWDLNWDAHPYFKKFEGQFGSSYIQTADEFALTCAATGAEPLVQMNAALALVEGVPAALDLSLGLLRHFTAAGLSVRYVSFGNENYGPWEVPYGDVAVDGAVYGAAFSQWVDGMRSEFPDVYYGVVGLWTPNDGGASSEPPALERPPLEAPPVGVIADWMEDMLSKTDAVAKADWLVLHDYFYKNSKPKSDAALLAASSDLARMPAGVAYFIRKAAPQTRMPPLALTEFDIATTMSAAGNTTARLLDALFMATLIGEAQTNAPVAALNVFSWHAKWYERGSVSGSYGMNTFGSPSWAPGVPGGVLLPKYFAFYLAKLVTGGSVLQAVSSRASLKAYATRFESADAAAPPVVGLLLVNHDLAPTRLSIEGDTSSDQARRGAAPAGTLNGWVLSGNLSSISDASGGSSLYDAPAVLLNGVGSGQSLGGPWPLDDSTITPYSAALAPSGSPTLIDVPPASVVALLIYPGGASSG